MNAINKLIEAEFAAGNAGDVEALLSLRTHDAVEIFPGELPLVGIDAIRAAWSQEGDVTEEFLDRSIEGVEMVGEWAFIRFSYRYRVSPKNGGDRNESNNQGLWILRKQADNSWKIHWEMVNTSDADK